jgi:hypothetical protein
MVEFTRAEFPIAEMQLMPSKQRWMAMLRQISRRNLRAILRSTLLTIRAL